MRQAIRGPGWLFITYLLCWGACCCDAALFENKTGPNDNNGPRVFSPRMDYDEWTPLGRGDPLKNDPTFDYVPPILDRVQYWMDSHTTELPSKSDILVLGVTAKKTSPKIPEQFLKFVNGPKFMRNQESSSGSYVNDFTGSRGAEPPKLIRKTNFRNGLKDYRNKDRIESIPASYYPSPYYNQNPKPETMMLPPPVVRNPDTNRPLRTYENPTKNHLYYDNHQFSTQTEAGPVLSLNHQIYDHSQNSYSIIEAPIPPRKHYDPVTSDKQKFTTQQTSLAHRETINGHTSPSVLQHRPESTTATVSSEKSNLIYQSSQTISEGWSAKTRKPTLPTLLDVDSSTWESEASSDNRENIYNEDVHQAAGSSHHEVVLGPNANIIVEGDTKEEIVMGQKEAVPPSGPSADETTIQKDENESMEVDKNSENMYIVLANSSPTTESKKDDAVTVVMPEKFVDEDDTTGEDEKSMESTSTPTIMNLSGEIGQMEDESMISDSVDDVSSHSQTVIRNNDPPVRPGSPTRMDMLNQQPPDVQTPHRQFVDTSSQRLIHHQASHVRPGQAMNHYNVHMDTGMGMSYRETQPPPRHHLGMPVGHVQPNLRYQSMKPSKTMGMVQTGHGNLQHVPPSRFHQHQYQQPTAVTTDSLVHSMIDYPTGGIRDLLLKEEAPQHNSQMMTEIFKTTTLAPSTRFNASDASSIVSTTKNDKGTHMDTRINKENSRTNFSSTMESIDAPVSTSTTPMSTTTTAILTTDPIFSHYKQPANPLRGPMYLIIQGHSKVKTYKPWMDKHGDRAVMRDNNLEITTIKQVSEFEKFIEANTKKIADAERIKEVRRTTERPKEQTSGRDSLLSFIDSGLGAFPVASSRPGLGDNNDNSLANVNGN